MKQIIYPVKRQQGFTLVEVMVAIAVAMVLVLGIVTIFTTTRHGYNTSQASARLQENVRYAVTRLTSEIRQAGFIGCQSISKSLTLKSSTDWHDRADVNILGYEGGGTVAFPTEFTGVDTNSDAIVIYRADSDNSVGYTTAISKTKFTVDTTSHGFQAGDILVVNNCKHTAITQATEISGSDITHAKDVTAYSPENCAEGLGTIDCSALDVDYAWDTTTTVMPWIATAYYLAPSSIGTNNSLYRLRSTGSPEELIEGVEEMQILYGEDTNGDGIANRYVKGDAVTDFTQVASIRIGMLFSSTQNVKQKAKSNTFKIADTSVTSPIDRKIRHAVNMTIKLRNLGEK